MNHVISVDELLKEVSPENSCGDDLEYDPDFVAMEAAARGKEEQRVGDSIVEAEEPEWRAVKSKAIELLKRSKDLRLAVYLTQSLVGVNGLVGLHDGLELIMGLIDQHWDELHPKLDPDDNNDPTMRMNTMFNLCGHNTMLRPIHKIELVSAKGLGKYDYNDFLIAAGKLPAPEESETPSASIAEIDAAFMDSELETIQENAEAVKGAISLVERLEKTLLEKVGTHQALSFAPVTELLIEIDKIFVAQLERRGVGIAEAAGGAPGQAAAPAAGEINSREDVIRVLEKACEYFRKNEPSSPVPLLLMRAKNLVTKEFIDIVRDLAPGGVQDIEKIRGPE